MARGVLAAKVADAIVGACDQLILEACRHSGGNVLGDPL